MFSWKRTHRGWFGFGRIAFLLAASAVLLGCSPPAPSQAQFKIPINLRCTTCNDFLRCAASPPSTSAAQLTVYRLNEKTFWAQVATIGDYLVQSLRAKTRDERPYTVYRLKVGAWHELEHGMASIDTVSARIQIAASFIDQRSGEWRAGEVVGRCEAMSRREGFALVRQMLGRSLPSHASANENR